MYGLVIVLCIVVILLIWWWSTSEHYTIGDPIVTLWKGPNFTGYSKTFETGDYIIDSDSPFATGVGSMSVSGTPTIVAPPPAVIPVYNTYWSGVGWGPRWRRHGWGGPGWAGRGGWRDGWRGGWRARHR